MSQERKNERNRELGLTNYISIEFMGALGDVFFKNCSSLINLFSSSSLNLNECDGSNLDCKLYSFVINLRPAGREVNQVERSFTMLSD